MALVDFTDWVEPDLVLPLGGHTYTVRPPSVAGAKRILARVVFEEIALGLANGPLPDELAAALKADADTPLADVTLGADVHAELVTNGCSPVTIERVAYYALFFWARGKERADRIAEVLWKPRDEEPAGDAQGEPSRR